MVTAELALAIMSLTLVLVGGLAGVGELVLRMRALDAAHVAARLAARGETPAVVAAAARDHAPEGSSVATSTEPTTVQVTVTSPGLSLGVFHLPPVRAEAVAPVEP